MSRNRFLAALIALPLVANLAACTGGDASAPSPTPSAAASPEKLELASMSDAQLLREAERATRGWINDVVATHESGSRDYSQLSEWATKKYREESMKSLNDNIPSQYTIRGFVKLKWLELAAYARPFTNEVVAVACFDNRAHRVYDQNGQDITSPDTRPTLVTQLRFVLAEDRTHLLIEEDEVPEHEVTRECTNN